MKSASENGWDAYKRPKISLNCTIRRAKLKYYCGKLNENISDPKTAWKMLNDLTGKKSTATEIDEILTWSNVTLNSAQEAVANHFNFHFTQISPNQTNLTSNLPTSSIKAENYLKKRLLFFLIC